MAMSSITVVSNSLRLYRAKMKTESNVRLWATRRHAESDHLDIVSASNHSIPQDERCKRCRGLMSVRGDVSILTDSLYDLL